MKRAFCKLLFFLAFGLLMQLGVALVFCLVHVGTWSGGLPTEEEYNLWYDHPLNLPGYLPDYAWRFISPGFRANIVTTPVVVEPDGQRRIAPLSIDALPAREILFVYSAGWSDLGEIIAASGHSNRVDWGYELWLDFTDIEHELFDLSEPGELYIDINNFHGPGDHTIIDAQATDANGYEIGSLSFDGESMFWEGDVLFDVWFNGGIIRIQWNQTSDQSAPVGACCVGTGCLNITEEECNSVGGTYLAGEDDPPLQCEDATCSSNSSPSCLGDISGPNGVPDGVVDVFDLLELLSNWGPCG